MSFEHEKRNTMNIIEPKFWKIKKIWNVFRVEIDFMVTKKGRNEKTMEKKFQHKKMKEMAHEKGNEKINGGLGMHDFSIFAEQMPYPMIENLNTKKANIIMGQLIAMFPTTKQDLWQRFSAHCIKATQEKKGPSGGGQIRFMCTNSESSLPWNTLEGYFSGWRS